MPDAPEHLLFAVRKMFFEPMLKKRRDRPWQSNNRVTGKLRARFRARLKNFRDFMIREPRNDRRNHHTNRNPSSAKLAHCIEARFGGRCARLEHALQFRIERRHGNIHRNSIGIRELDQKIDVARHETVLGNDRHRVAKFREHLEAPTRDSHLSFDRLVRVGHSAHDEDLRLPFRRR